ACAGMGVLCNPVPPRSRGPVRDSANARLACRNAAGREARDSAVPEPPPAAAGRRAQARPNAGRCPAAVQSNKHREHTDSRLMMEHGGRTAFVFAGGGSLGAIQVGMLRSLIAAGVQPDFVVGASVGALNASYFAGAPNADGV